MKAALIIIGISLTIVFLVWLGLQIKPRSFSPIVDPSADYTYVPLPVDLPLPVERFYNNIYGERIPIIETAVISGRGRIRIKGITFPARYRFTHVSGQDYHHYIEATFYGLPVFKVNEFFLNGNSQFELPFGTSQGPKVDQGANLALWAEAVWMPAVWLTDSRVRWEPVDDDSALLFVPFGTQQEQFLLRFDPQTGLLVLMESMRYKGQADEKKTLWLNRVLDWEIKNRKSIPRITTVTWLDEGTPWAEFITGEVAYNLDVAAYIQQKGP